MNESAPAPAEVIARPTAPGEKSSRRHWSSSSMAAGTLGRRLLIRVVAVVALVAVALSAFSTLAVYRLILDQHDLAIDQVSLRQTRRPADGKDMLALGTGTPFGTIVVRTKGSYVVAAMVVEDSDGRAVVSTLSTEIAERIAAAADPRRHVSLVVQDLGAYRFATRNVDGEEVMVGMPLETVNRTIRNLILLEAILTTVAIASAALVTRTLVTRALDPLNRLAEVSRQVADTPLHKGQVALGRVPPVPLRVGSEISQLGDTMNDMLSHVEQALSAREESESRVRTFVADASHELRNPLAAIRGYAELTRRDRNRVPEGTAFALSRVESEAERMSGLVEDLLLLARLDADRDLEIAEVDLTELAVNALSDARVAGPDHRWQLILADSEPVVATGDGHRLHQVLANLLTNARTHTPAGTTVELALRSSETEAMITVTDDGPGIAPELVGNVFERFTRADQARSRTGGNTSTGLGLAIVSAVVEAHDGRVSVSSEPGNTVFSIMLPLATTDDEAAETST